MKLLTFAVPCYNSESYIRRCVDSLLPGGNDVEILIVDDGSRDGTAAIADEYERDHPGIVRAIHKENGGHGSAVNTGIDEAAGLFFKVVDSDDWVNLQAYMDIMVELKELTGRGDIPDVFVSNFVYEKEGARRKKVMRFRHIFPEGRIFSWEDAGFMRRGHYILMHSVIYRTRLLRECGLRLPEHTFYVDNLYVYEPLLHVKKLFYLDRNFYRYYIGREDQSVNEDVMIGRVDQQLFVNRRMIDFYTDHRGQMQWSRQLARYMFLYLEIVTCISEILLIKSGTEEALKKRDELLGYIKQRNFLLYLRLRYNATGECLNLPGKGGRRLAVGGYRLVQKIYHFN
ncbi:MAG: glycosyltransferase family 2 protein [Lachnospiraceae bacterium]|nr:glycosyltransferase family 2 protein [Lachnospiraceae bacterium]